MNHLKAYTIRQWNKNDLYCIFLKREWFCIVLLTFLTTYFCWVWHGCFVSLLVFQRAWLLKLLAVELHAGDISSSQHRDACQTILFNLFGQGITEVGGGQAISPFSFQDTSENAAFRTVSKSKVLIVLIESWFLWYYGLLSCISWIIILFTVR